MLYKVMISRNIIIIAHGAQRRESARGFTLIELIMVIVLLGILAAVVTPRYIGFVEQSRSAVAKNALGEGLSRFNMGYAKYLIEKAKKPADFAVLADDYVNATINLGDFAVGLSQSGSTMTIGAYDNKAGTIGDAKTGIPSGTPLASTTFAWPN